MGADLTEGRCSMNDMVIQCPWHGYIFDMQSSRFTKNPNRLILEKLAKKSKTFSPDKPQKFKLTEVQLIELQDKLELLFNHVLELCKSMPIHSFTYEYDLDTTVAVAVITYLDVEHYMFLHHKHSPNLEIVHAEKNKYVLRQVWHLGPITIGQEYTAEYLPPATMKNYDVKPINKWFSVHSLDH